MTFTSYTTPDGKSPPMELEEFISKLIPAYTGALKPWGIEPNIGKYKEFIRSGIWSRHICKTTSQDNISAKLPLMLRVTIDSEDVHAMKLEKKGDNLIAITYMGVTYEMSTSQINSCESEPLCDREIIISDQWERWLSYSSGKPEPEPESKLDEILRDLKSSGF